MWLAGQLKLAGLQCHGEGGATNLLNEAKRFSKGMLKGKSP
jgi:hypothetical protein